LRETVERLRVAGDQAKAKGGSSTDPLAEALSAVRAAALAVANGRYGKAPAKDVRGTRVTSRRNPATRSRHISASGAGAERGLERPC
jgi:hypothetical protein